MLVSLVLTVRMNEESSDSGLPLAWKAHLVPVRRHRDSPGTTNTRLQGTTPPVDICEWFGSFPVWMPYFVKSLIWSVLSRLSPCATILYSKTSTRQASCNLYT